MRKIIDLTGNVYGRLTVISYNGKTRDNKSLWRCLCECGTIKITRSEFLRSGTTSSCGCLRLANTIKLNASHGDTKNNKLTQEYRSWLSMRRRCNDHKHPYYHNYGGRGITVCDRWERYSNFLKDMGRAPSPKHTLDRKENHLGYSKDNCRWATKKEQANNRRTTKI